MDLIRNCGLYVNYQLFYLHLVGYVKVKQFIYYIVHHCHENYLHVCMFAVCRYNGGESWHDGPCSMQTSKQVF